MSIFDAIENDDEVALRGELAAGGDPNAFDPAGSTPLMSACTRGSVALVGALLAAGADATLVDGLGETALLKAAANGHREIVGLLWPLATEDERSLAGAMLRAQSGEDLPPPSAPPTTPGRAVEAAAAVARFFGDEVPAKRLERIKRAQASLRGKGPTGKG